MRRLGLLALLLTVGCAKLLDIEERTAVVVDGGSSAQGHGDGGVHGPVGDGGVATPTCAKYCSDALELCTTEQQVQAYETLATCSAVCAQIPPGDPAMLTGNTLSCRSALLDNARRFGEAATICQAAGPSGGAAPGGGSSCGTNCESYCHLRQRVCPTETESDCMRKCQGIPDVGTFNAGQSFRSASDTLHCRMAHLSVAAAYQAENDNEKRRDHCLHSGYKSTGPCDIEEGAFPRCADYCKIVNTACTGDLKVYESTAQCEQLCAKLPLGTGAEKAADTVRCRRENAYEALRLEPTPRTCDAAGPASLECGGSKCTTYCKLAQEACPAQFAATYPDGACEQQCNLIPDSKLNFPYSVASAVGDSLRCRVLGLVRAIAGDPRACESALGRPTEGNVCKPSP